MSENRENQKRGKMQSVVIQNLWRVFFSEAFIFCLILGLGITTSTKINEILKIQEITPRPLSIGHFILAFLSATLFVILISRFDKIQKGKSFLFKGIFILAAFLGGGLLLGIWLGDFLALILIAILCIWWLKSPSILVHNLMIVLGISGIGAIIGLRLSPWSMVLLLIIFSIYDFIAVYKTKHMIKIAKEMIAHRAILALIVPQKISDFKKSLKEVKSGGKFLILGGGDVAFPLLLCTSLIPIRILDSLIVAIFALIGLFVSFWFFINQKVRAPIPALPPIAFFSIIGFLISKLI